MKKHARTKKKNIKILLITIAVIIFLACSITYLSVTSDYRKLIGLGYNKNDAKVILNKLDSNNLNLLFEYGKIDIISIISHKNFDKVNFSLYLKYLTDYEIDVNDAIMVANLGYEDFSDIDFLISLVNDSAFDTNKSSLYVEYYEANIGAPANDVVTLVNAGVNATYSPKLVGIVGEKYFINNRLNRYISYASKFSNYNTLAVVTNVNTNLDYNFYTNIKDVDTSKGELMLANKYYKLPTDYYYGTLVIMENGYTNAEGAQLNSVAYSAFKNLVDAAALEGLGIRNNSAYRTYSTQGYIYTNYANEYGQVWADTWSARPGHSEHQTGLALDVGTVGQGLATFNGTQEFYWMKDNCYKYGFILRYPEGKEYITGYGYEPWHYRYVGVEVATYIYEKNITFDEYYAYYVEK